MIDQFNRMSYYLHCINEIEIYFVTDAYYVTSSLDRFSYLLQEFQKQSTVLSFLGKAKDDNNKK